MSIFTDSKPENFPTITNNETEYPWAQITSRIHGIPRIQCEPTAEHSQQKSEQHRLRCFGDFVARIDDGKHEEQQDSRAAYLEKGKSQGFRPHVVPSCLFNNGAQWAEMWARICGENGGSCGWANNGTDAAIKCRNFIFKM